MTRPGDGTPPSATRPEGVLLAQLGTPDAPTPSALRRYLAEFLSDRRVVDLNPLLWWVILHGIVLRTRPRRAAALYRHVWTPEGSPLLTTSRAQQAGLAERLGAGVRVELGMGYGEPSIGGAIDRLVEAGCTSVLVLPMFPQYSSATTASVFDAVARWARGRRAVPGFTFVRSFPDEPGFVASLAAAARRAGVAASPSSPLLVSFHGLPQRFVRTGDPYPDECLATARALASALDLPDDAWRVVYQSKFGREPWLEPSLDATLVALAEGGTRSVSVATPSFVADCLETIDEVGRVSRGVFRSAGGETFVRVPCPNAEPSFLDALASLLRRHAAEATFPHLGDPRAVRRS